MLLIATSVRFREMLITVAVNHLHQTVRFARHLCTKMCQATLLFLLCHLCCLKRLAKNDPRNPFGCVSERAAYSLSCVVYFILIVYIEVKCYQIASIYWQYWLIL